MTSHYSEDELTLYYYGEGEYADAGRGTKRRGEVARHLDDCAACAAVYREIAATLALVAAEDVPERGTQYGLEVWQRLRHQLPEREGLWFERRGWLTPGRLAFAAAAALLVVTAFVAGRMWRPAPASETVASSGTTRTDSSTPSGSASANGAGGRQRVLLTAVADHLERTERVLTDIMNAPAHEDISTEQDWAEDLLTTSRLYRQDALDAGERSVAAVLDDLERNLLDIVHSPARISAADLEQLRRRIDAAALLFKVRVMSDELRRREAEPQERQTPRTSTTSSSKTS